jgi:hypothetical protein
VATVAADTFCRRNKPFILSPPTAFISLSASSSLTTPDRLQDAWDTNDPERNGIGGGEDRESAPLADPTRKKSCWLAQRPL